MRTLFFRFFLCCCAAAATCRLKFVFWHARVPRRFVCFFLIRERIAESQALTIEQLIRDKSAVLAEKAAMETAANGVLCSFFSSPATPDLLLLDLILCSRVHCNVFDALSQSFFSTCCLSDFSATCACQIFVSFWVHSLSLTRIAPRCMPFPVYFIV